MRARLLDIGEVGPVRSQSTYHAVLAGIGEDDDPALLVARPVATLVSVGDVASDEIDLQASLDGGLPVVRRLVGGPTEILDENDLLIQIVMPVRKAPPEAPAYAARPVVEMLAGLGINAEPDASGGLQTAAGRLGRVQAAIVDSALCIAYSLTWSGPAGIPGGSSSSVTAEMDDPISLADLAEALLVALESHFSLELIPSMPAPGELEAVYEWDSRLLIETVDDPPLASRAPASLN